MNPKYNFFQPNIDFRSNLNNNIPQVGLSVGFNDPLLTESISDDVDFLWYDLEHVLYDNSSINLHLLACRFKKTMSFVRLGDFTSGNIKNVLDAGANGIIAAQIKSYEEALIFSNNCILFCISHIFSNTSIILFADLSNISSSVPFIANISFGYN